MLTSDAVALTLTQAMGAYDVDQVLTTLAQHGGAAATKQRRANLVRVFRAAQADHLNLLRPPGDFYPWLRRTLDTNENGTPARPNSIVSRLSALRTLYRDLRAQGLLHGDPLLDFQSPGGEAGRTTIPSKENIDRLLEATRASDAALHATLLLLTRHALQVTELLTLTWSAYRPETGVLLRHRTAARLDDACVLALDVLLARQGGPLHLDIASNRRILPYDTQDALRLRIFQTCGHAGLPFLAPAGLRRSALRDHALSATDAGYSSPLAFERAVELARRIKGPK